jgi:molybdopterin synthase catalytic subunit
MKQIKVLFFASLRDYAGSKSMDMEIPDGTTILDLENILAQLYPRFEQVRTSMMAAINHEYVADDQVIPEHAEIAFFPPVSGG